MVHRPTGQVVEDPRRPGVFGLRFRAYGKRRYQGLGKVSLGEAEAALRYLLVDIERGVWQPPAKHSAPAPEVHEDPTFHEFASEWFTAHQGEWRPNTRVDYGWQLTNHLLPVFAGYRLSEITVREVDRYRAVKVAEAQRRAEAIRQVMDDDTLSYVQRERKLHKARELPGISPASINKTITRLGQILEVAKEYKIVTDNPARGKNRRLKVKKAPTVWIDRAEHAAALLDAARELDREAPYGRRHVPRRVMLATFVLAGLRISELTGLRWRDVDLVANRITVRESKTDAGVRTVDLLPALADALREYKQAGLDVRGRRLRLVDGREYRASLKRAAGELVFPTSNGKQFGASNIRRRVLDKAVERANERLAEVDDVPLPEGLTPHKLRHTFCSVLVALGVDPGSVMDQMGHTDASFTMRVYRHGMRRDPHSKQAWRELVGLVDQAVHDPARFGAIGAESGQPMGSQSGFEGLEAASAAAPGGREIAH
jgi:integrase